MSEPSKQKLCRDKTEPVRDTSHRLGFMQVEFAVPDDFDQIGRDEVARLYCATTLSTCGYCFNRNGANKR